MTLKSGIKHAWEAVANSQDAMKRLRKRTLEDVLEEYLKLLLVSGVVAAIVSLLYALGQAFYYDFFRDVSVQYLRLLNYSASISAGTFFTYLFAGTMLLGIVSLVLRPFLGVPYVMLVRIMCIAASPVLLFGWLSVRIAAVLLLWTLVLFVIGVREHR